MSILIQAFNYSFDVLLTMISGKYHIIHPHISTRGFVSPTGCPLVCYAYQRNAKFGFFSGKIQWLIKWFWTCLNLMRSTALIIIIHHCFYCHHHEMKHLLSSLWIQQFYQKSNQLINYVTSIHNKFLLRHCQNQGNIIWRLHVKLCLSVWIRQQIKSHVDAIYIFKKIFAIDFWTQASWNIEILF